MQRVSAKPGPEPTGTQEPAYIVQHFRWYGLHDVHPYKSDVRSVFEALLIRDRTKSNSVM